MVPKAKPEIMFSLFPNPANEFADVTCNREHKSSEVILCDALGKEIKSLNWSESRSQLFVPISDCNPGLYSVRFEEDGETVFSSKLIIIE
ncbi:MAG: T9SS type A sorting domain-containing protein [Flavobacteriales bacterium]|nr:T9SS type A sorting domain-containing protein [Flavobacteriales bacterium]